jgi:hypothetical protein
MKTIYKYEIPVGGGEVMIPNNAKILSVGAQGDSLMLWAEVNPDRSEVPRRFEVFGTGHEIREYMGTERQFIGTALMGPYVWHI